MSVQHDAICYEYRDSGLVQYEIAAEVGKGVYLLLIVRVGEGETIKKAGRNMEDCITLGPAQKVLLMREALRELNV